MNMVAIGIGGLLVAGGAYLSFVQKKRTEGKVTELRFMKAVSLAELDETWKSLANEGLVEGYRDIVETNGKAETDGELKAPYSNAPCAYFEATVTREFEKEERVKDKDGNIVPRNVINTFTVKFGDREVFRALLSSGISANPFIAFFMKVPGPTK